MILALKEDTLLELISNPERLKLKVSIAKKKLQQQQQSLQQTIQNTKEKVKQMKQKHQQEIGKIMPSSGGKNKDPNTWMI